MSYEQKPNTGSIFKNDRKEKENQPDYRGTINVNGKDWSIALWVKDGKKGKFFSASISEPQTRIGTTKEEKTFTKDDNEMPF